LKVKIDLHTHCGESTGDYVPKVSTVRKIIDHIKMRGLDGIAVTEHDSFDFGYRVKNVVDRYFPGEVIIIPGREICLYREHIVELELQDGVAFRFCAHPFFGSSFDDLLENESNSLHGIEIKNAAWQLQETKIKKLAKEYDWMILENSDAHSLNEIGLHYNEFDLEELCNRCNARKKM